MGDVLNLLTLLNPSRAGTEFFDLSTGRGISGHEVRAALVGLEDGPHALADWIGTENEISRQQCRDCMANDLRIIAAAQNWRRKNDAEFLKRMSEAAIAEILGKTRLCRACHGTGVQLAALCKVCAGKGHVRVTIELLAKQLGVSANHWGRDWADKYLEARFLLHEYKKLIREKLRREFRMKKQEGK